MKFFLTIFCQFPKKSGKRIFRHKVPEKKSPQNIKKSENLLQLPATERVLKIFRLSYFEYHQIWLNILMADHHLSNIAKY
jgi:hypothetical protein